MKAKRAVMEGVVHLHVLDNPLPMDPDEHVIGSFTWDHEFRLRYVLYQLRHYVWITHFWGDSSQERQEEVCEVPSEEAARNLLAFRRAFLLACSDRGELASAGAFDEVTGAMLFTAKVLDGHDDGIWLVSSRADQDGTWSGQRYEHQADALEDFATIVDGAASSVAARMGNLSEIITAYLHDQAARARAAVTRVALGDAIRRNDAELRAMRAVSQVAGAVSVSREFLYRVLAGNEWTWPSGVIVNSHRQYRQPAAPHDYPEWKGDMTASISFGIATATQEAAIAGATEFLESMDLAIAGSLKIARSDSPAVQVWIVTGQLDVSRMPTVTPDNAETNLSYLAGHFPLDLTWSTHITDQDGRFEWPERDWLHVGSSARLDGYPQVIGITIAVSGRRTATDR